MDRHEQFSPPVVARVLTAALVAAGAWLLVDMLASPAPASASALSVSASGTDDSLLGGLLGTVSPVVEAVDGHVGTVTEVRAVPAPIAVAEVIETVDSTVTEVVRAVPIVDNTVTPVVTDIVTPITRPILEPVVDQVATPVLDAVVTPVIDTVTAPITPAELPLVDELTPVGGVSPSSPEFPGRLTQASTGPALDTSPVDTALGRAALVALDTTHGHAPSVPTLVAPSPASADSGAMPALPALPAGPAFLPAAGCSSTSGGTSGGGPSAVTVLPSGLLPAPQVSSHSLNSPSDTLPAAPSFDPGSTPG